jgi:hypothetical protein
MYGSEEGSESDDETKIVTMINLSSSSEDLTTNGQDVEEGVDEDGDIEFEEGQVVTVDGGVDFEFRVGNAPASTFEVVNLCMGDTNWAEDKNDHLFFALKFPSPVTRPIMVEIWESPKSKSTYYQLKQHCLRRFYIGFGLGIYKRQEFGHHVFYEAPTHQLHMVPDGSGWDTVSFGLINRQITAIKGKEVVRPSKGKPGKPEDYIPQWLLLGDFGDILTKYSDGKMHMNGFCPMNPEYWVEGVLSDEEVPQKWPVWHYLRKCKLPGRVAPEGIPVSSSMSYKIGMGCFTDTAATKVDSIRCMRAGSLIEDVVALAFVQYHQCEYYEKGWRVHPSIPYWGDSTDGYIICPWITWEVVPDKVRAHWAEHGITPETHPDISHGMLEIKCSDTALNAPTAGYYMPQCSWHEMCWDEPSEGKRIMFCILLRAQVTGGAPVIWYYFHWRDFDFEKRIVDNVRAGSVHYKEGRIVEWGKTLRKFDKGYQTWARNRTKNRDDVTRYPLDGMVPWPCRGAREYMELLPKINHEAATRVPGRFPDLGHYVLEPLYRPRNAGWLEDYPICYKPNPYMKHLEGQNLAAKVVAEMARPTPKVDLRMTHYQNYKYELKAYHDRQGKRLPPVPSNSQLGFLSLKSGPKKKPKLVIPSPPKLQFRPRKRDATPKLKLLQPSLKRTASIRGAKGVAAWISLNKKKKNATRQQRTHPSRFIETEAKESSKDEPAAPDLAEESPVPLKRDTPLTPAQSNRQLAALRAATIQLGTKFDETGHPTNRRDAISALRDLRAMIDRLADGL